MKKYIISSILLLSINSLYAKDYKLKYEIGYSKVSFSKDGKLENAIRLSVGDTIKDHNSKFSEDLKISIIQLTDKNVSILTGAYRPEYEIIKNTNLYTQAAFSIASFKTHRFTGLMFGAGIEYKINKNYFTNLDYLKGTLSNENSSLNTSIISLNIGHKF